jgi:Protein of unknown function (DUF2853)
MANASDYFADVKNYASSYNEAAITGIVKYLGGSLANKDSAIVASSDPTEVARLRASFLVKKLGLPDDDSLDKALDAVFAKMKGDRSKERVTVYYMLADHFGKLDMFT